MYLILQTAFFLAEKWKYCSKKIFKCINSIVRPIFNIFFNKVVVGLVNSALCLLKAEMRAYKEKKKKKKKRKTLKTQNA